MKKKFKFKGVFCAVQGDGKVLGASLYWTLVKSNTVRKFLEIITIDKYKVLLGHSKHTCLYCKGNIGDNKYNLIYYETACDEY